MTSPKKVAIIYNYIAHYRIPIFNLLSKNENPQYTIISGTKTEVQIKTAGTSLSTTEISKGGIRWQLIKNRWFFRCFLWQSGALRHCFSNEFDTIIFLGNMYYLSTWIGTFLAKKRGKKVIFWTHGFIRQENNLKGFARSFFYRLADELLTYGQRAKDILVSKGFDPDKIRLIYNSLDYDHQKNVVETTSPILNTKIFSDESLPTFGFIGRLTKQKNIDLLIKVLEHLHALNLKANLLLIGDGSVKAELQEMVELKKLSQHVCFWGECYDEKLIYQLLKRMKVVVSPGEVGLTAIHAMTYGIPVITHNRFDKQMPEFECVKPGLTGDFFDYNKPIESLAKLLQTWFNKKDDDKTERHCTAVIDEYYNPYTQLEIFNSIV